MSDTGRVLTLRELNRTLLVRQLVLRRVPLSPVRAIERVAGVQAQEARSPYVGLWSRVEGFRRRQLERALRRDAVVKATLMRATLHLVSARDYPLLASAVRDAKTTARTRGVEPPPATAVARAAELARERPVTRRELLAILGHEERIDPYVDPRPLRRLHWLLVLAHLEPTADGALWTPARVTTFRVPQHELAPKAAGLEHLVRRYLRAFGPATGADISEWSGVPVRDLTAALESLPLRSFRDERDRELLDLRRAPVVTADVPSPPRLLPRWDNLFLAHADRTRVLADEHRKAVIGEQAILVDGFAAGTWREEGGRVVVKPFAPLPPTTLRDLEDEARRLEAWLR